MRRVTRCLVGLIGAAVLAAQDRGGFDLNDKGVDAAARGDQAEAERLYREAMEVWRSLGPAYEAHLATTEYNLAQTLCAQGKRRAGAQLFEDSVAHYSRTLGPRDIHTLGAKNLLGGVYLMLGDVDRAEALFLEALAAERTLYPNDIQLARSLDGLVSLKLVSAKTAEALPLAEEALAVSLKTEGEDSLDAALAYANVAEVHRSTGQRDRAYPLFRKSRTIYERVLGPDHPRVASMLDMESLILMADGKLALAEQEMLRAADILAKTCPNCVFEQWIAESNLALLRMKQKKYDEAERLLTHALSLQEKEPFRPGTDIAATLQTLAAIREKQRRYDDAASLHRRADTILAYR